jgi:resuscitation-promoting factor RpfA
VPYPATQLRRRWAATVPLVAASAATTALLVLVSPTTLAAARAAGADVSALVAAAAVGLAWLLVGRLLLTTVGVLAASAPGAVGAAGRKLAVAVTPRLLRSVVQMACGACVVAGRVAGASPAFADPPDPAAGASASTPAVRIIDPRLVPVLDRAVQTPPPPRLAATGPARVVVVRSGDSLWSLAERELGNAATDEQVSREWPRWYAANAETIGPDPAVIRPGERLLVPSERTEATP